MADRHWTQSQTENRAERRLVQEVARAVRGYHLYDGDTHPVFGQMLEALLDAWEQATATGPLALRLTEKLVTAGEHVVHVAEERGEVLPTGLYEHGVVGLILRHGLDAGEARRLVRVLACEPHEQSDYASLLWDADLGHVQVLLDVEDDAEEATTPEDFARQVASLGGADDPTAPSDIEDLANAPACADAPGPFTDAERADLLRLLSADGPPDAARHALRVVHDMARNAPEEAAAVEQVLPPLVAGALESADVGDVEEILARARAMEASEHAPERRAGELTVAALRRPEVLSRVLDGLDRLAELETPRVCKCLGALGASCAGTVARWLPKTRHGRVAALALRGYGEAAVDALLPLYGESDRAGRDRIAPVLLGIGTPAAVEALAPDFERLPEKARLQIVRARERSCVLRALADPSPRVRRAAAGALRRGDGPEVAKVLEGLLASGALERADRHEAERLFDALARIGDAEVARVLAGHCLARSILPLRRRGPTPLQEMALKALRRMHAPDARAVVDDLRSRAPEEVRSVLDDRLAGVDE
jgi:hypothetical protein